MHACANNLYQHVNEATSDVNRTLDGSTYPGWKMFHFIVSFIFSCSWKQNRLFPGPVLPPTWWWSLIGSSKEKTGNNFYLGYYVDHMFAREFFFRSGSEGARKWLVGGWGGGASVVIWWSITWPRGALSYADEFRESRGILRTLGECLGCANNCGLYYKSFGVIIPFGWLLLSVRLF